MQCYPALRHRLLLLLHHTIHRILHDAPSRGRAYGQIAKGEAHIAKRRSSAAPLCVLTRLIMKFAGLLVQ
jgi:hypothetical protein